MTDVFCQFQYETKWRPSLRGSVDYWLNPGAASCQMDAEEMRYARNLLTRCRPQRVPSIANEISRYTISDQGALDFVARNPDVAKALLAALPLVSEVFGMTSRLTLVVAPDSDDSACDRLVCFMQAGPNAEEALGQLSAFRRAWRRIHPRAQDKLTFSVEID